ncbi:hypothetical protein N0V90_011191 [Kalmusia sp. IMI 367209]|nr:hypothetical protein N0V90_011191 [Kalmusia sp. IMI 367209]
MNLDTSFDPEYSLDLDDVHTSSAPPCLPTISTTTPIVHAGCCLALCTPLLAHLHTLLPAFGLVLSIGSGYGFLEALLAAPPYNLNIVGVEVEPSPNKYLPEGRHRTVVGSRFLEPLAREAEVWLFVYPRRVGLVEEYVREVAGCVDGKEGQVKKIVWIGPTRDWEDYKGCFRGWDVEMKRLDEVGGRVWETIAVAWNKEGQQRVAH